MLQLIQDSVDDKERLNYTKLIETIGWFFSDLFILGYVEDPVTGNSFRFPGGMQWAVYVEVSSCRHNMKRSCRPHDGLLCLPYKPPPPTSSGSLQGPDDTKRVSEGVL